MSGTLFCNRCEDVIYSEKYERVASKEQATIELQKHIRRRLEIPGALQNGHGAEEEMERLCKSRCRAYGEVIEFD
jgi:hypothetical protein